MENVIYALKGNSDWCDILTFLKNGEGRFGWSYINSADLKQLKARIDKNGWDSLSNDEKDCYQSFLLELKENDYVIYINVPEWGKCTLARVTGQYEWNFNDEDFNHRFPVDPESVYIFDRNDAIVHPSLSSRLKLQGRWWRIYQKDEFFRLISSLKKGETGKYRSLETNLQFLSNEIKPFLLSITEQIHHTHPNYDLESLIAKVFENVSGVRKVKLQGGRGDYGADILVTFEAGLPVPGLESQQTLVVQVKSFEGEHWDTQAAKDIRRAFEHYPDATMGLIISTAISSTKLLEKELDKLRKDTGKPVSLLIGSDVAAFLLRFGTNLLA